MSSGRSARDLMSGLADLFRPALDLFREFEANADVFDQYTALRSLPFREQPSPATHAAPRALSSPRLLADENVNSSSRDDDPDSHTDSDTDSYSAVDDSDEESDGADHGLMREMTPANGESDRQDIHKLITSMPDIEIAKDRRRHTPAAMNCQLMPHQRICLTWMRQQEEDENKNGGLLADTMGLGKTIEALALILDRPSRNSSCKTTLVVAPLSLLRQWEREIQEKVRPGYKLKTMIYHGQARKKTRTLVLHTYDVVLTTYGVIQSEAYNRRKKAKPVIIDRNFPFYRVILDEAHHIKNRRAKCSEAALMIKARYRWCMTGTPFMNRSEEIYSLLRFLRIKPYNDWDRFHRDINVHLKSDSEECQSEAMTKLQAVFRSITLRRTKASIVDGAPIVENMPPLFKEDVMVKFNDEQKNFYKALENKQRLKFNSYTKNHPLQRKYTYILMLLLRLRQACCHPHLIRDFGIPEGAQLDSDEMRTLAKRFKRDVVERLKAQAEFICPACGDPTENPLLVYPCGHLICSTCFSALMEIKRPDDEKECDCLVTNCTSDLSPESVICHCFFLEAHMPEKSGSDSSEDDLDDESDGFESFGDDDVDERGNLKGFIASDSDIDDYDDEDEMGDDEVEDLGDDGEDEEDETRVKNEVKSEGSDANDSDSSEDTKSPVKSEAQMDKEQKVSPKKEESPWEQPEQDDSDYSIVSLHEVWRRSTASGSVKVKSEQTKREDLSHSVSDDELPVASSSVVKGKRKRSSGQKSGWPNKKSKRNDGVGKRGCKGKKKEFVSLAALKKASSTNPAANERYMKRLRKEYVPSAKIEMVMELLEDIRKNHAGEKVLIFSLWTSFLDLLEIPVHDAAFRYTRYDGTMAPAARDAAVKAFMERPDMQLMMISLTAGNTGLNLTAASHVIILEPFWNPFVEDQAIDRAHRIGQKNGVTVHRLLIENTVEDRIRDLQEKKRQLVNTALSDAGAQGISRLSISELRGLFGLGGRS
ncbi:SNF2 family N-terminal domain-containing protein [Hypoxylon sp. FL1284]|nr:SNF2 family N-terminal domain-containing protein [Hypoxylon sp. FL1284]